MREDLQLFVETYVKAYQDDGSEMSCRDLLREGRLAVPRNEEDARDRVSNLIRNPWVRDEISRRLLSRSRKLPSILIEITAEALGLKREEIVFAQEFFSDPDLQRAALVSGCDPTVINNEGVRKLLECLDREEHARSQEKVRKFEKHLWGLAMASPLDYVSIEGGEVSLRPTSEIMKGAAYLSALEIHRHPDGSVTTTVRVKRGDAALKMLRENYGNDQIEQAIEVLRSHYHVTVDDKGIFVSGRDGTARLLKE
jgi:hypothetical protein